MLGIMWLSRAIKDAGHECQGAVHPRQGLAREARASTTPTSSATRSTTGMHLYFADDQPQGEAGAAERASASSAVRTRRSRPSTSRPRASTRSAAARARRRSSTSSNRMQKGERLYDCENFWFKHRETGEILKNAAAPARSRTSTASASPTATSSTTPARSTATPTARCSSASAAARCRARFCFHHAWKKKIYNVAQQRVRAQALGHAPDRRDQRGPRRSTT